MFFFISPPLFKNSNKQSKNNIEHFVSFLADVNLQNSVSFRNVAIDHSDSSKVIFHFKQTFVTYNGHH